MICAIFSLDAMPQISCCPGAMTYVMSSAPSMGGAMMPMRPTTTASYWKVPQPSTLNPKTSTPHPFKPNPSPLTPHTLPLQTSPLTPHPSPLTPHPSPLTPHPAPLTPHPSPFLPLTPHPSPRTPHRQVAGVAGDDPDLRHPAGRQVPGHPRTHHRHGQAPHMRADTATGGAPRP